MGFTVFLIINAFPSVSSSSLVCLQFRVFTAPFHRVEFADFWLADQLNSLVFVLMDMEYLFCFYIFELQWSNNRGLLPKGEAIIQSVHKHLAFICIIHVTCLHNTIK